MKQRLKSFVIQIKSKQILIGPTMIQMFFQGEIIVLMIHLFLIQWLKLGTNQMMVL